MRGFRDLILLGNVDELVREVDRLADRREWDELDGLRRACRAAIDSGHQLWPVSDWATYRLTLHGPTDLVTEVLLEPPPRFPVGPLTEVAAQDLDWEQLGAGLDDRLVAVSFAHERVLRGEVLAAEFPVDDRLVEVPMRLAPWEPEYVMATYSVTGVDPGEPPHVASLPVGPGPRGEVATDLTVTTALEHLVAHQVTNGEVSAAAIAVRGAAEGAAAHLLGGAQTRWSELDTSAALALWAWHAAGGRRRAGAAAGRLRVWWALAAVLDLVEDWPVEADELGEALDELRFAWFGPDGDDGVIGLAVEDLAHDVSWALRIDPVDAA
ncbi:MAG: hypothetical protein AAFZ07_21455 [Actinomycetota bacterium]